MNKTPAQKGPIISDQKNMKHKSPEQKAMEDHEMRKARSSGQSLKEHTPKK